MLVYRLQRIKTCTVVGHLNGQCCAQSAHQTGQDVLDNPVPAALLAQVDQSISFTDLRSSPDHYVGRTVLFGENVIMSHRVKDRTEIEILQLPMVARMPSAQRTQSEGRFIAVRSGEFLDPAVMERDAPLTIVGEVKGAVTKPLDGGEYQYPVLEIKQIINWKELQSRERTAGYRGGDGYGGFNPYYGGRFSSPGPAPVPSSAAPPRDSKKADERGIYVCLGYLFHFSL